MSRPRALDLFCGAGGVSVGLERSGFDVTAVDIRPQPHHRGGRFVQANALTFPLEGYDFIWASPPCQAFSSASRISGTQSNHPDLIDPMRERLTASGAEWVIENVAGAPLRIEFFLCGSMFGLGASCADGVYRPLRRHRFFESSMLFDAPPCRCNGHQTLGVYGHGGGNRRHGIDGYFRYAANTKEMREGLGIDWMPRYELTQAIPPAYAEWIGRKVLGYLSGEPQPARQGLLWSLLS